MLQNLRVSVFSVIDTSNFEVEFTHNLSKSIGVNNVIITSQADNVANPKALKVTVSGNKLTVECQHLTPLTYYTITFVSVDNHPFISINGDAKLFEDDESNAISFYGPEDDLNPVKQFLTAYLENNVYDLEDRDGLVYKQISAISETYSRALYDIGQVKNDNYISVTITDEEKTRTNSPYDRLNEEGTYEVTRVAKNKTGALASQTIQIDSFTHSPFSLGKTLYEESVTLGNQDLPGVLNINNFVVTLSKFPAAKLISFTVLYNSGFEFNYDIPTFGYQIKNGKYDLDVASSYATLEENQIKLNNTILSDVYGFSFDDIFKMDIQYEYINLGFVIDPTTLTVFDVKTAAREVIGSIQNVFDLQHAPIVDSLNKQSIIGGVSFQNSYASDQNLTHPAFILEIPFKVQAPPSNPGEYAVDYETGRVYVFGADTSSTGTGAYPPVATYQYRYVYVPEIDYVYDDQATDINSENDFCALPYGNLIGNSGSISFNYEIVLVQGIDYKVQAHAEELAEAIENRLVAPGILTTLQSPITNVFRVYNQSSGEIYNTIRWDDNKIYFDYKYAPAVIELTKEKVKFDIVNNEFLFLNLQLTNSASLRIFKINLTNNLIASSTEDSLGSVTNSSVYFTNKDIFTVEKSFSSDQTETQNIDRLSLNDYCIDYQNGVIYVAVSTGQSNDVGQVSYKYGAIKTDNKHIISVENVYYKLSNSTTAQTTVVYDEFTDNLVFLDSLRPSAESYLNGNLNQQLFLDSGKIVTSYNGSPIDSIFTQVKLIRGIYEDNDWIHSPAPFNFASTATLNSNNIYVNDVTVSNYDSAKPDIGDPTSLYVVLDTPIAYISPNITYSISLIKVSDNSELWNGSSVIVPGLYTKLYPNPAVPINEGDVIQITVTATLNDTSNVVIDYSAGDLFVDYTYLADEIIVSYEHGDNQLDFRQSLALSENDTYYVTYKVGALRDGLLKNFGQLINIPELTTFNIDFDRERYRDAVYAALSSFIQGPTVAAIKNIGNSISHIVPEVNESLFNGWSLGTSILQPRAISSTGAFSLLPGKFGNGALINDPSQSISFPMNSSLRLEEGTFETWVIPNWNGIDNTANLNFKIIQDGYLINPSRVFIGGSEYHPTLKSDGSFDVSKDKNAIGMPNETKDGIFIYLDYSSSGLYKWNVDVYDGYTDGYINNLTPKFDITIQTDGEFHYQEAYGFDDYPNSKIFSGRNKITFKTNEARFINQGILFTADKKHYILDVGETEFKNRISLYKDPEGYLVFKAFDKFKNIYTLSHDVSDWSVGDKHFVSISWKFNSDSNRDEMHLFVDGLETHNIVRFGDDSARTNGYRFRELNSTELFGISGSDTVGFRDGSVTLGQTTITTSVDLSAYAISPGDPVWIDDPILGLISISVTSVTGQVLHTSYTFQYTVSNLHVVINRQIYSLPSDYYLYGNFYIATMDQRLSGSDADLTVDSDIVTFGEDLPSNYVSVGDYISFFENRETYYTIVEVEQFQVRLNQKMVQSNSGASFVIYFPKETEIRGERSSNPSYSISLSADKLTTQVSIENEVSNGQALLLRSLGLNHRKISSKHYVWSDNTENVIPTKLPQPATTDSLAVYKIILDDAQIKSTNSTVTGNNFVFHSDGYTQTSDSAFGRTLEASLHGLNIDFTNPVTIAITGVNQAVANVTETLTFTDYTSLNTTNRFISISAITISGTVINTSKQFVMVKIIEKFRVTYNEDSSSFNARVNYTYPVKFGTNLQYSSVGPNFVNDDSVLFTAYDVGKTLVIQSPTNVAGFYKIIGVSDDRHSIEIKSTSASYAVPLAFFNNGYYQILNSSDAQSGYQNGFFEFEQTSLVGQSFLLRRGMYKFDYPAYTAIRFDPIHKDVFVGSSLHAKNQFDGIIDHVKIYSVCLTDVRYYETSLDKSVTKDYNSIKAPTVDDQTLFLASFDSYPFVNTANSNLRTLNKSIFTENNRINANFDYPASLKNGSAFEIDNYGILDTRKEGSIEFWMAPQYDTQNDPNNRYYFDAYGAITEEVTSIDNQTVSVSSSIGQVLSVKLKTDKKDYLAGGKVVIDSSGAVEEFVTSADAGSVVVSSQINQVVSVTIVGDITNKDYFLGGAIDNTQNKIFFGIALPQASLPLKVIYKKAGTITTGKQLIKLNKQLPYHNSTVEVTYLPKGIQGDRMSIFKDTNGYVNFYIKASNQDYSVRAPTVFTKHSWHRIKATYKMNSGKNTDSMKLFVDGYEWTDVVAGSGIVFNGEPYVVGGAFTGESTSKFDLKFKDVINQINIGSDYLNTHYGSFSLSNLRISNISRPSYKPFKDSIDPNYSSTISSNYPVTQDLYTTYLLESNFYNKKYTDFAVLVDKNGGNFDFDVTIFDSFGIVGDNLKSQNALEKLIKILKPANSKVSIDYVK